MSDPNAAYRRPADDPAPATDKLLILSAKVPPGGEYVRFDGEYTIKVSRRGVAKRSGWYLVTATWGEEVAAYWTGTEWRPEVGMLDPATIPQHRVDRLVLLEDIVSFLAVQPRVAMNLEQLAGILRQEFE